MNVTTVTYSMPAKCRCSD